jgi:DNA adenine methylase
LKKFYIDPPYFGCENYYGKNLFSREDFAKIAEQLRGVQGKFLLSINDTPEIREVFKDFYVKEVATKYTAGTRQAGHKDVIELLYSGQPFVG